jgi:sterol desaturase/sphingolipid hydroxylase (fatty acid hydroxylase superfamily)
MNKAHQSIRIFKSDFAERFTHVHPITPLLFWTPVIAWLSYQSYLSPQLGPWTIGAWAAFGLFIWTLFEYLLHRFIFHFPPLNALSERFVYITHGLHHDDPVDPTRLVMPPFAGVCIALIMYSIFRLLFGPAYVQPFFAAFLAGYLCYDYTHYAVHHFTPRTRFGKFIKQSHMTHHYVNPDTRWGVSTPLWDHVFGTYGETKRVQHGS